MKNLLSIKEHTNNRFKDITGYFEKVLQLKRLERYMPIIDSVLTEYNKKSCDETMMIKGYRKSCEETTNRKTHMENHECLSAEIAQALGLNVEATRVMAKHHDIGHTFLGHSGEWWLSNIKEDNGMGYYIHNALGARELVYSKDVYSEIIDKIKFQNPNISEKKLKKIKNSLWLIIDAINSHNGERADRQAMPNSKKTEKDFMKEILDCHTKKKFDKGIEPATPEAALMKICDKISYIPSDMVDGIREGFIEGLDDEYIRILKAIGITGKEIDLASKSSNYDQIAKKVKDIFKKDLIQNSSKRRIKMSDEMTTLMYKLLDKNNKEIVNFVLMEEDLKTYPAAIRELVEKYSEEILEGNFIEKIKNGETWEVEEKIRDNRGLIKEDFWKNIYQMSVRDLVFTVRMLKKAAKQSINDELEIAQKVVNGQERYKPDPEFENKNERIKKYILYYQNRLKEGNYDKRDQQIDAENLYHKMQEGKLGKLHLGMDKRVAMEISAQFIASLSDSEFMQLLMEENIIDEKKKKSLTRKYKDIDIRKESQMQSNWISIEKSHENAAKGEISK